MRRALRLQSAVGFAAALLTCAMAFAQTPQPAGRAVSQNSQPAASVPAPATAPSTTPSATDALVFPPPGMTLDARSVLQKAMTPGNGNGDGDIRFGMTGPFSGPSREFGRQLAEGIDAALRATNDAGGVNGRRLRLITADDGYEFARTPDLVRKLVEQDHVTGFIGSFGTANAQAVLPWLQERRVLFYAPFTGAPVVRANPPDAHTFNYRPSYAEETEAAVRYLVNVRGIRATQIAVFAQDDGFGQAGYDGAAKALRALAGGRYEQPPLHLRYKRNTIDVAEALGTIRKLKFPPKAIVMVALYRPAAKFIEGLRAIVPDTILTNVSAVGSSALAEELALLGPKFVDGVVVTQVVPAVNGFSKLVFEYKEALGRYFPGEQPDYLSFEGYVQTKLLIEALRRAGGGPIDGDKLANALEGLSGFDIGLGTPVGFSASDHQAIHTVWGTMLDAKGQFRPIDLK